MEGPRAGLTKADGGVVDAFGAVGGVGVRPAQVQAAVVLGCDRRRGGVVLGEGRQRARYARGAVWRMDRIKL